MNRIIAYIFIIPIRAYQKILSPILSSLLGMRCRYEPSCSHYMADAILEWGPPKGIWMGLKRLMSCHPWGGYGEDPVPPNPKKKS